MGHRLHFATTYKVQWGGGYCNHHQEEFNKFLHTLCACDWAWADEDEIEYACQFEIEKSVLKDAIQRLKEYTDDELSVALQDANYSVAEIEAILRRCLEDSEPEDDLVHFEWF